MIARLVTHRFQCHSTYLQKGDMSLVTYLVHVSKRDNSAREITTRDFIGTPENRICSLRTRCVSFPAGFYLSRAYVRTSYSELHYRYWFMLLIYLVNFLVSNSMPMYTYALRSLLFTQYLRQYRLTMCSQRRATDTCQVTLIGLEPRIPIYNFIVCLGNGKDHWALLAIKPNRLSPSQELRNWCTHSLYRFLTARGDEPNLLRSSTMAAVIVYRAVRSSRYHARRPTAIQRY